METVEESIGTISKSDETRNPQVAGMAMGKYPKGILAHSGKRDCFTGRYKQTP
jgi:hypothetical protein